MNKLQKKAASAIAVGALLVNSVLPVFAGTTIVISGNGADSYNKAEVEQNQTTVVNQSNEANIQNNVNASANSGKNDANRNTGGSVSVDTGNASTSVGVANSVNTNEASVACCQGDVDVLISGNGADSKNKVELELNQKEHRRSPQPGTYISQENEANIKNYVDADSNTGKNDANRNTNGDVSVTTGKATTSVGILNQGNANSATVSGGQGGAMLSARILDNGADTHNKIDLDYSHITSLDQSNESSVRNHVDADADSGKNDANRNTGGTVSVDTGDAMTTVEVGNTLNFNWADVDCGCLLDVLAKIAGNGDDSKNKIELELADELYVNQENECGGNDHHYFPRLKELLLRRWHREKPCLDNDVYADADTGKNDANRNTEGDHASDPSIDTGNATTDVIIDNAGNSNVFGQSAPEWDWELPFSGFSFNLNLSFNLADLLGALGLA